MTEHPTELGPFRPGSCRPLPFSPNCGSHPTLPRRHIEKILVRPRSTCKALPRQYLLNTAAVQDLPRFTMEQKISTENMLARQQHDVRQRLANQRHTALTPKSSPFPHVSAFAHHSLESAFFHPTIPKPGNSIIHTNYTIETADAVGQTVHSDPISTPGGGHISKVVAGQTKRYTLPAANMFSLPTGETITQQQMSRRKHFSGFPSMTEPLPYGIQQEEIIKKWPNHLWGPLLLDIITKVRVFRVCLPPYDCPLSRKIYLGITQSNLGAISSI